MPRNPLFRLLLINGLAGVALAALFVAALVWLDPKGLGHLLVNDQNPAIALIVLVGSFVVTFASLMMGSAVMLMSDSGKDGGGGGRRVRIGGLIPVPILARPRAEGALRREFRRLY